MQWDQYQVNVGSSPQGGSKAASRIGALTSLRYMMLTKILEGLDKACRGVNTNKKGTKEKEAGPTGNRYVVKDPLDDLTNIVSGVQFARYNEGVGALTPLLELGKAVKSRSLKEFQIVKESRFKSDKFFAGDIIMRRHLPKMEDRILLSNLVRVLEPYSVVELSHVASLIEGATVPLVEKKLGQLILDGIVDGVLDQGRGCIIINEAGVGEGDNVAKTGVGIVKELGKVVQTLLERGGRELH